MPFLSFAVPGLSVVSQSQGHPGSTQMETIPWHGAGRDSLDHHQYQTSWSTSSGWHLYYRQAQVLCQHSENNSSLHPSETSRIKTENQCQINATALLSCFLSFWCVWRATFYSGCGINKPLWSSSSTTTTTTTTTSASASTSALLLLQDQERDRQAITNI